MNKFLTSSKPQWHATSDIDLKTIRGAAARTKDLYDVKDDAYTIGDFKEGYRKYFGCGHHLYIFINDENVDYEKVLNICNQRVNPRLMAPQLSECLNNFRLVMLDVEMGGCSVWMGGCDIWGKNS